jgi:hypothetical protein
MTLPTSRQFWMNYINGQGQPVSVPTADFMTTYGHYAVETASGLLQSFRDQWANPQDGYRYTNRFDVNFYNRDILLPDWFDRALNYGFAKFDIDGYFRLIDGEMRFQGTITPVNDNWDFISGPGRGRILDMLAGVTRALLDPGNIGQSFGINYQGSGMPIDMSHADFQNAAQNLQDSTQVGFMDNGPSSITFGQLAQFFTQNMEKLFQEFPESIPPALQGGISGLAALLIGKYLAQGVIFGYGLIPPHLRVPLLVFGLAVALVQTLRDPLILDLDGDGVEVSALEGSTVFFDYDGDGVAERTGWASQDDGFLAIDVNNNGAVDGIHELFGSPTQDGFAVLETFDHNSDGVIDADDAVFASLRVWRDLDQDGVSDAGELQTLTEAGITEIALTRCAPIVRATSEGVNRQRQRVFTQGTLAGHGRGFAATFTPTRCVYLQAA